MMNKHKEPEETNLTRYREVMPTGRNSTYKSEERRKETRDEEREREREREEERGRENGVEVKQKT